MFKPFSENANGKSVCFLNITKNHAHHPVSIADQCSKNDFYGQNQNLENAIRAMEGYYSTLRNKIIAQQLAYDNFDKQTLLKRFILFQHMRTKAQIDRAQTAINQMGFIESNLGVGGLPTMRDHITFAMRTFGENMEILDDLKTRLSP